MRHVSRRAGEAIGPYRLVTPLGAGSNSEVWRTSRAAEEVALKILRVRAPTSEPSRRFRDEIEILGRLGTTSGILPLLAFHLPEAPSRRDPAWLAMPIATPIRTALEGAALSDIVKVFTTLAETLVNLAQRGIFHRDIKPENLYQYSSWRAI
jgi:serine/threonine protein kinase